MKGALVLGAVLASALFLVLDPGRGSGSSQAGVSMDSLPDLVVTNMRIEFEAGSDCNWRGKQIGTRVWVKNIGGGDAGPFVVELVLGTNSWQKTVSSGLAAGQTTAVWFPEDAYGTGYPTTATADATLLVTESNEENNTLSEYVPVPTPPVTCTPTPTPTPRPGVGGIVKLPPEGVASMSDAPSDDSGWAVRAYAALAGGMAGVALAGGVWYAIRRGKVD